MKKIALVLLMTAAISNAQNWEKNKVKGNGNVITQMRNTAEYDEIITGGQFSVQLIAAPEGKIIMEGDENLLALIKVEVENNKLKVYVEKGTWFDSRGDKIKITIPFEKISRIDFGGSGDLKTKDLIAANALEVHLSGSGNVDLQTETTSLKAVLSGSGTLEIDGKTTNLEAKLSGSGGIECKKLVSQNATATLSGSGQIDLNCTKSLEAKVTGSGNINYTGKPETVIKKVTGSGEISNF